MELLCLNEDGRCAFIYTHTEKPQNFLELWRTGNFYRPPLSPDRNPELLLEGAGEPVELHQSAHNNHNTWSNVMFRKTHIPQFSLFNLYCLSVK